MANGVTVEFKGLEQMFQKLNRKVRRLETQLMRKALLAFAEPIRAEAERLARALISPRIQVVTQIRIRGQAGEIKIGPHKDFWWTFFWEYGYELRRVKKGPSLRHIGARPFMRPAYDARKQEGLDAMAAILRQAVEQPEL